MSGDTSAVDALPYEEEGVSRRQLLQMLGVASIGAGCGVLKNMHGYANAIDIRRHTIQLPHMPHAFDGLRIGHITDLHVADEYGFRKPDDVRRAIDTMMSEQCDVMCITGDYGNNNTQAWSAAFAGIDQFRDVPIPRFAVLGNHEHQAGVSHAVDDALRGAGVTLLRDEEVATLHRNGDTLQILGTNDHQTDTINLQRIADTTREAATIVLTHNAEWANKTTLNGKSSLVLAGHTHGGQIDLHLSLTDAVLKNYTKYDAPYVNGVYEVGENIVSVDAGFGTHTAPLRTSNVRGGFTIYTLKTAA